MKCIRCKEEITIEDYETFYKYCEDCYEETSDKIHEDLSLSGVLDD